MIRSVSSVENRKGMGSRQVWDRIDNQRKALASTILGLCLPALIMGLPSDGRAGEARSVERGFSNSLRERVSAAPAIHDITTNEGSFPGGQVPRYEKLEITFQVDTVAENLQWPYDPSPPPGIEAGKGVSVSALFTPDDWNTVYTQPAFYYQEFDDQIKSGEEWFYPTGGFSWKVRFSPDREGTWHFKLVAEDAGGRKETLPESFSVVASTSHGFVRVSDRDPRYFEFQDGTYFPGLGYNMNYDHVSWYSPVLDNRHHFEKMSQNGIQLIRIWQTEWSIFSASWNPWNAINGTASYYIPWTWQTMDSTYPGSEVSMVVFYDGQDAGKGNPCMFIGAWKASPAVKRNTNYRIRVRYKTMGLTGPLQSGKPYGFVAKVGGWLWDQGNYCYEPGSGTPVTPYASQSDAPWGILEGSWASGERDFLPDFYLAVENTTGGTAFVNYVWIEEDLGGGQYGPNIVSKPWMDQHKYMEQRNSYAFDKLLDLAREYSIYLRPVILEKNDWTFNSIDFQGNPTSDQSNDWFYGNGRTVTKVRWLHQTWWRYLQARWGYSTNIHSWELLNEGDPGSELHFIMADEFGEYMHQFAPNDHLVSTSFWDSFPKDQFWANPLYPNIDFADLHYYIPTDDWGFGDSALATAGMSLLYGAKQPDGAGKPLIRGETGFTTEGSGPPINLDADTEGVWLHNFIWGGINPGGMIESYWYEDSHIYSRAADGSYRFDHRPQYRTYYSFIKDVPLNNGFYEDAAASASDPQLRAWGQKDLVHGRAHLWIQNAKHTWKNVVDGVPIPELSSTVRVGGFQAGKSYTVEWWDPYQTDTARQVIGRETVVAGADQVVEIEVSGLATDVAVKIFPIDAAVPTFADVPFAHRYYDEIEALYQAGYTAGCNTNPLMYCPEATMNRAESSVFVERGIHTASYDPPTPSSQVFADMPLDSWAAKWVNGLWQDQYTAGCGTNPLIYCPWQGHTRAEGCVFYLRMLRGASYEPAQPAQQTFVDVPLDTWYAKWVQAGYDAGLLPACQTTSELRFCPNDPLTRALAAHMMVQAKGLH